MYYLRRFTGYPIYCYFNAGFVKNGIIPFYMELNIYERDIFTFTYITR